MRKAYLMIWLVVVALCPLTSLAASNEGYKEINTLELKKMMDSDDKPILVNSLSPIEFGEEYIPGSICIPMELMKISQSMPEDYQTKLVFYCYGPS